MFFMISARIDGALDLDQYAAIGDGRSVGLDGSIDWWCVPDLDSPPLFDKILRDDVPEAGYFGLTPTDPNVLIARHYLPDSNVLETTFTTSNREGQGHGVAQLGPGGSLALE